MAREQLENQGEAIRAIQKAKADLANRIASIIGAAENDSARPRRLDYDYPNAHALKFKYHRAT